MVAVDIESNGNLRQLSQLCGDMARELIVPQIKAEGIPRSTHHSTH